MSACPSPKLRFCLLCVCVVHVPRNPQHTCLCKPSFPLTAATVLTLGTVGYVVLEWLTNRILSFIIEGRDQNCGTRDITVTDRDQTEVKRGGSRKRTWESEKVIGAKTWRWEVRLREGRCTGTRRVDERWSILNSSITFFYFTLHPYFYSSMSSEILRLCCVQRSAHKRLNRSKNNINGRLTTRKSEKAFSTS